MTTIDDSVTLWNDKSLAAIALKLELRNRGYFVREVFSGASKPVAQYGSNFFSGFSEIRSYLI